MKEKLEKLCYVKKEDFDKLFNDFFELKKIDKTDFLKGLDYTKCYKNFDLYKIDIKDSFDGSNYSYENFINCLINYVIGYYYDGNKDEFRDFRDKIHVLSRFKNFKDKPGISMDEFSDEILGGKKLKEYSQKEIETSKEIKKFLKDKTLKIENIAPNGQQKYIIFNGNKKNLNICSGDKLLGNLHGEIGEFILFFLVESILKYPILFSKIGVKTDNEEIAKGSDGIHISIDQDGNAKFIFLESKFMKGFKSCINNAITSQINFLEKKELLNEISIIQNKEDLINKHFNILFQNGIGELLNPYTRCEIEPDKLNFDFAIGLFYYLEKNLYLDNYDKNNTLEKISYALEKYKENEKILQNKKVNIFLIPLLDDFLLMRTFLLEKEKHKNGN